MLTVPMPLDEHDFIPLLKRSELYINSNWQIKKYAAKLKEIASILTGIPVKKFEDQDFKKTFLGDEWNYGRSTEETPRMTVRELLQKLGTEAMRDGLHTNTWVNALFADYKSSKNANLQPLEEALKEESKYPNWIISDLRFPNEFDAIKERGGICIRINRGTTTSTHPSEVSLDNHTFDYVIENDGSISDLVLKVETMLKHFQIL